MQKDFAHLEQNYRRLVHPKIPCRFRVAATDYLQSFSLRE
jgi:hypothetical protein